MKVRTIPNWDGCSFWGLQRVTRPDSIPECSKVCGCAGRCRGCWWWMGGDIWSDIEKDGYQDFFLDESLALVDFRVFSVLAWEAFFHDFHGVEFAGRLFPDEDYFGVVADSDETEHIEMAELKALFFHVLWVSKENKINWGLNLGIWIDIKSGWFLWWWSVGSKWEWWSKGVWAIS